MDGDTFLWRINKKTRYHGDAPLATTLTVQRDEERPGRVCQVMLRSKNILPTMDEGDYLHRAALYPTDVRQIIAYALQKGWDPAERGVAFKIEAAEDVPELADYELR